MHAIDSAGVEAHLLWACHFDDASIGHAHRAENEQMSSHARRYMPENIIVTPHALTVINGARRQSLHYLSSQCRASSRVRRRHAEASLNNQCADESGSERRRPND